jgi:UDP-glucose 4,6-dehydratase
MEILILGQGFVGDYLFDHLGKDLNRKVLQYRRKSHDYLTKDFFLDRLTENSIVINCSGYTGKPNVDACEDDKEACFNLNAVNPVIIQNYCKLVPGVRYIHVSSGCIYTGYEKEYTEYSKPNFGIWNTESSYYSKTKHLAEIYLDKFYTAILRIRMPFCGANSSRNLLVKLLNYDNLINQENSLTCMEDFAMFVEKFILQFQPGIYNVVNTGHANGSTIVEQMSVYKNLINPRWKFIRLNELQTRARRSNCVLSTEKIESLGLALPSVGDSLQKYCEILSIQKVKSCQKS